ncbi:MAG: lysophospholipid acyltransferase family protein [Gemmatimonadales bacterium]
MSQLPTVLPTRGNRLTRGIARVLLRALGWRMEGSFPEVPKLVVIAAPHSSNWDFVIAILYVIALGIRVRFIAKQELFRGPMGWLMRWAGGTPVDRSAPRGVVEQVVDEIARTPKIVLGITPEGTRRYGAGFKSGFYRIAHDAGVPIVPGFLDWSRKAVGVMAPFTPTGEMEDDVRRIRALYGTITRKDGRQMPTGE